VKLWTGEKIQAEEKKRTSDLLDV